MNKADMVENQIMVQHRVGLLNTAPPQIVWECAVPSHPMSGPGRSAAPSYHSPQLASINSRQFQNDAITRRR